MAERNQEMVLVLNPAEGYDESTILQGSGDGMIQFVDIENIEVNAYLNVNI